MENQTSQQNAQSKLASIDELSAHEKELRQSQMKNLKRQNSGSLFANITNTPGQVGNRLSPHKQQDKQSIVVITSNTTKPLTLYRKSSSPLLRSEIGPSLSTMPPPKATHNSKGNSIHIGTADNTEEKKLRQTGHERACAVATIDLNAGAEGQQNTPTARQKRYSTLADILSDNDEEKAHIDVYYNTKKGPGQQQNINQIQFQDKLSSKKKNKRCKRHRGETGTDVSSRKRNDDRGAELPQQVQVSEYQLVAPGHVENELTVPRSQSKMVNGQAPKRSVSRENSQQRASKDLKEEDQNLQSELLRMRAEITKQLKQELMKDLHESLKKDLTKFIENKFSQLEHRQSLATLFPKKEMSACVRSNDDNTFQDFQSSVTTERCLKENNQLQKVDFLQNIKSPRHVVAITHQSMQGPEPSVSASFMIQTSTSQIMLTGLDLDDRTPHELNFKESVAASQLNQVQILDQLPAGESSKRSQQRNAIKPAQLDYIQNFNPQRKLNFNSDTNMLSESKPQKPNAEITTKMKPMTDQNVPKSAFVTKQMRQSSPTKKQENSQSVQNSSKSPSLAAASPSSIVPRRQEQMPTIPTPSPTSLANLSARREEVPEFDDLISKKCANQGYNQEISMKSNLRKMISPIN